MPKANFSAGGTGALTGAGTGFAVGGPVGGIIGGLLGGVSGLFGGAKKKKKKKMASTLDKRQQALNAQQHDSILGKGPLADLYNYDPQAANAVFDQSMVNPAYRNFNEQTVPGITGAFRSNGLQNSSYAGDAISKIARDLQESLNAQRGEYLYNEQNNARNAKRNAVENLQNRQTFNYDVNGSQNSNNLNNILGSITPDAIRGIADSDIWGSLQDTALKYLPGGV